MASAIPELPELKLGHTLKESAGEREVTVLAQHRARGMLINGQSGLGKSSLMTQMIVQDMKAGLPMLIIDPHDLGHNVLQHVPRERVEDVVILSLRADQVPLWSIHPFGGGTGDMSEVANLLVDAWRAQYGEQSVGVRAEGILYHSLLSLPPEVLSPLELMAVMVSKDYRRIALDSRDMAGLDFPLHLFWREVVDPIRDHWHEWNQSTFNKIAPLLLEPWPRRAFSGTPPAEGAGMAFSDLELDKVDSVTWLRDRMYARNNYDEEPNIIKITDELDPYLVEDRVRNTIFSAAIKGGVEIGERYMTIDSEDPSLRMPSEDEAKIYGRSMGEMVSRRRRRRGWRRFSEFYLEANGKKVKETLDIADLLDDNRIIIVEIPQIYGFNVTRAVATFALLGAIMRGNRQLQMPESHQIPMSLYIDEASLFLSPQMERTLAELRKAKVCMTLAVQRLGQFGGVASGLRRGLVDTVGTIITLNPGVEEIPEIAKMLSFGKEKIQDLARGHAIISRLKSDWSREKTESFGFEALVPPDAKSDPSLAIRAASYARYYQEPEQADAVFRARAKRIQATFARQPQAPAPGTGGAQTRGGGKTGRSSIDSLLQD